MKNSQHKIFKNNPLLKYKLPNQKFLKKNKLKMLVIKKHSNKQKFKVIIFKHYQGLIRIQKEMK